MRIVKGEFLDEYLGKRVHELFIQWAPWLVWRFATQAPSRVFSNCYCVSGPVVVGKGQEDLFQR